MLATRKSRLGLMIPNLSWILVLALFGCFGGAPSEVAIDFDTVLNITLAGLTDVQRAEYESAGLSGQYDVQGYGDTGSMLGIFASSQSDILTLTPIDSTKYSVHGQFWTSGTATVEGNTILIEAYTSMLGKPGKAWGKAADSTWQQMTGRWAFDDGTLGGTFIMSRR